MADERYTLHAYVCGTDCVQESLFEGVMTARQICNGRPAGCRYAVVSNTRTDVLVWDLYAMSYVSGAVEVRRSTDVRAAVVSTAMLYE